MFYLRLRSGLYFESGSKRISCPGSRVVHAANSQEFTVLRLALGLTMCLAAPLKTPGLTLLLPLCGSKWPATWGMVHVLVWRRSCSEGEGFSRSAVSPQEGCWEHTVARCLHHIHPEGMRIYATGFQQLRYTEWPVSLQARPGPAQRDSASGAGPWCGSGHLGSPELCMPFTPEDWAECGTPLAGA